MVFMDSSAVRRRFPGGYSQQAIERVLVQTDAVGPAAVIVSPNVVLPLLVAAVQLSQLPVYSCPA